MYPDVDMNRHMNNTVYIDMLYGFAGVDEDKQLRSASINYLHEAPLGTTFKVYGNSFCRHVLFPNRAARRNSGR